MRLYDRAVLFGVATYTYAFLAHRRTGFLPPCGGRFQSTLPRIALTGTHTARVAQVVDDRRGWCVFFDHLLFIRLVEKTADMYHSEGPWRRRIYEVTFQGTFLGMDMSALVVVMGTLRCVFH